MVPSVPRSRRSVNRVIASAVCFGMALVTAPARAETPLGYLRGSGAMAHAITPLTWGLLIISLVVCVIVMALVLGGILVKRAAGHVTAGVPLMRGGGGTGWVGLGVGISSVVLLGSLVWTVVVLAAINEPPSKPGLTIEVTGQQWWWKVRYLSDDPSRILTTANEIHIPTGEPVRVELIGADVIHSFWVPLLSGKTDAIPGQTNVTWLEADRPGRYRGLCSEYCGVQHAQMGFYVVAQSPDEFDAWWDAQLKPAATAGSPASERGAMLFTYRCGACHTVRGTEAGGAVAPDLTHLMSRATIAAGTLPNNVGSLSGWIANPQAIKPGTLMPIVPLSGPELNDIGFFLLTLK
ncbi:MAG TPA: cytochrome c oxidase subunit II [Stellaceae bacterium]|jgi:cytochrome c oxidase subunit 2|nr:cytochrome c oxidase subunit II [Stellaceae bacterium]